VERSHEPAEPAKKSVPGWGSIDTATSAVLGVVGALVVGPALGTFAGIVAKVNDTPALNAALGTVAVGALIGVGLKKTIGISFAHLLKLASIPTLSTLVAAEVVAHLIH